MARVAFALALVTAAPVGMTGCAGRGGQDCRPMFAPFLPCLFAKPAAPAAPAAPQSATASPAPHAALAPADQTAESRRITEEIRRMLSNLKSGKYAHVTRVDEAAGHYEVDCSGVACYVLARALPEHFQSLQTAARAPRLSAQMFQGVFARMPDSPAGRDGWRQVVHAIEARPGDIVAWRAANPKPGSTGHVVIVDGAPAPEGSGLIRVPVVDSTPSRQWLGADGKTHSGLGRRDIWLQTDAEGHIVGYRWSPTSALNRNPVAIGRPASLGEKG